MSLSSDFSEFLQSVKNSEAVSQELREAITVQTGLEPLLRAALLNGRDVVVAGSAGGGKTHLLTAVHSQGAEFPRTVHWPSEPEPVGENFIRLVPDATAIPPDRRQDSLMTRPANCVAIAVAINEGPLLDLARRYPDSPFAHARDSLHEAQRGILRGPVDAWPVVIDVGGYDPVADRVIDKLLQLNLLHEAVAARPCKCEDPRICYRQQAWRLLDSPDVRSRINDLVRFVSLGGQPVLFREVWDFVADIALGGDCAASPPSSPWFWRVFHGDSRLSARLREVIDPAFAVFPRAEIHAWYGDWSSGQLDALPGIDLVPLGATPPYSHENYRWIKTQLFFTLRSSSTFELLRDQLDLDLAMSLQSGDTHGSLAKIISALNRYMTYGTLPPSEQVVPLWTDMGVERRLDRVRGQVALGEIASTQLALRRSKVVANGDPGSDGLEGSRFFLVHDGSNASLALTPEFLHLVRTGRSYRSSDRPHTDIEWQIARFYSEIAGKVNSSSSFRVLRLDFDRMEAREHTYNISVPLGQIERALPAAGSS
jgi:hypothetical protein